MDNKEFASNTSIIINDGKEGFQKWNGDTWEQVHLAAASEAPQEEVDHLEAGLPMKVMRFMGLPKSYRETLYNEFVPDVSRIPVDTAASFLNIVSWVCGKNEENGIEKSANICTLGEGETSVDNFKIVSTSSTDSVGPLIGNVGIIGADSVSSLKIVTPFGTLVDSASNEEQHVQVIEAVEVEPSSEIIERAASIYDLDLNNNNEVKTPHSHILELDDDGKVMRIPSRPVCSSETSIYGYGMSETESERGFLAGSIPTTPTLQSENEEDSEEVKRVTFAPSSETNIYAYQDYEEEEEPEEESQNVNKESKSNADTQFDVVEENDSAEESAVICKAPEDAEVPYEKESPALLIASPAISFEKVVDNTYEEEKEKVEVDENVTESTEVHEPQEVVSSPHTIEKPPPTTSEVQLQLNNDLKTLEEIVKKLYKNLNKKGPVTIVANFKPKNNGELSLDMGSFMNRPKLKIESEKSEEKIAFEVEGNKEEFVASSKSIKPEGTDFMPAKGPQTAETNERTPLPKPRHLTFADTSRPAPTMPATGPLKSEADHKYFQKPRPLTSADLSRPPPVSIMKNSPARPNTSFHHTSPLQSRKCRLNVPKYPASTNALKATVSKTKTDADKNNNAVEASSLKPAIKQRNRMPSLRPAASSHSVTKTSITSITNNRVDAENHTSPKAMPSKHYIMHRPNSQHLLVQQPAQQQQHYKILEASNSQRYLVPVPPQQNHLVVSGGSRSASQHVLVEAPKSQHVLVGTSNSNAQHILMEAPYIVESPRPQQVIMEPRQPFEHILVETPPPPTCQNPHLHPRTATILPPPTNTRFHSPSTTSQFHKSTIVSSSTQRGGSYRLIQPCSTHTNHQHDKRGGHDQHEDSAVEDSASNASVVSSASSTFTGVDGNLSCYASGAESVAEAEQEIPVRISKHSQSTTSSQHRFHENPPTTRKPSIILQARNKQSNEKIVSASPSATKQQYRTTVHIPTGLPKPNSYRAIFKERQQQQNQQTVYVDLTSKGLRRNR